MAPGPTRRRLLGTLVRVALGVGLLAWIVLRTDLDQLAEIAGRVGTLAALLALGAYGLATVSGAARYALLLRTVGAPVSFPLALRLTYVGYFASLALPGQNGGDLVKAGLAARETARPAPAIAATVADRLVGLVCITLLAAGPAMAALRRPEYREAGVVSGAVLAGVVAAGAVYFCPPVRRALSGARASGTRLVRGLGKLDEALVSYRGAWRPLALAAALSLVSQCLAILSVATFGHAIGLPLEPTEYLLAVPAIYIVAAVPITPSGIGTAEAAYAFFLTRLGVPEEGAVALALLSRATTLLYGLAGGVVFAATRNRAGAEATSDAATRRGGGSATAAS
ncbi:MAG: flippase-like domain-containing protein [Planctomycetales bacterium]|nr:flippase-like domain-containing protein [Planctomycetales bacterium]